MAYSTEPKIRQEAGFQGNANITTTLVEQFMTTATNVVNGYVARRYSLSNLSGATFTGSQAASVLEEAERLYAAGKLMLQQYQGQPMGETNGQQKVDAAQKILDDIASGNLRLLDTSSDEFTADKASSSGGLLPAATMPARENADVTPSEKKFNMETKW